MDMSDVSFLSLRTWETVMIKRISEIPSVVTCFGYRPEYITEVEGMLTTLKEHHPTWPIVLGKGPVPGFDRPTLDVESPFGASRWTLPVPLELDDTEDDWRRLTRIKGWWISCVWRHLAGLSADSDPTTLVWIDADARLNGPLDIELEIDAEVIAGPWLYDSLNPSSETICSGLLVFQGERGGIVEKIIERWERKCLSDIQNLPEPTVSWLDSDQEVLSEVLRSTPQSDTPYSLIKLNFEKYAGIVNKDGTPLDGALVDQWQMSRKMKFPECHEREWPPPEHARRREKREIKSFATEEGT